MLRNNEQNRRLHQLIGALRIDAEMKGQLVYEFTNGRTSSSSEMEATECRYLISHLAEKEHQMKLATKEPQKPKPINQNRKEDKEKANKMRRKVFAFCHQLGWYVPGLFKDGKPVLDYVRIDKFCIASGHAHKALNDYKVDELPMLVSQFETVFKTHLKSLKR
ncbi:hypothetical protein BH09BAC1_BH09BAC1_14330 [soil metagenome]